MGYAQKSQEKDLRDKQSPSKAKGHLDHADKDSQTENQKKAKKYDTYVVKRVTSPRKSS